MTLRATVLIALSIGLVAGGLTLHQVSAQSKLPAYVIVEVKASDDVAYKKEFAPLVRPAIEAQGGMYLARGGKSAAIEGEPPSKMAAIKFDDLQSATAAFTSPAYKELRKVGDRYATFRIVAIEGLAGQ